MEDGLTAVKAEWDGLSVGTAERAARRSKEVAAAAGQEARGAEGVAGGGGTPPAAPMPGRFSRCKELFLMSSLLGGPRVEGGGGHPAGVLPTGAS